MPARAQHAQTHTNTQARVSFRRIEEFLSRSADDVRNEEAYGKMDSDRHCSDLKKGQLKIENGEGRVRGRGGPRERKTLRVLWWLHSMIVRLNHPYVKGM